MTIAVWVLVLDAALVLAFGVISTDQVFLSGASFQNIALGAAMPVVLAVGFALLLGAGEFDLSLGANLVLSSVVGAKLMTAVGGGLGVSRPASRRALRSGQPSARSTASLSPVLA